jgi:hypothetical protein
MCNLDLKQYALAKQQARKAYQLGYPLPGLRKKLASVGAVALIW